MSEDRLDVTVIIPTIPPRVLPGGLLERALASVWAQTLLPDAVSVAVDVERRGAAHTRQRALSNAKTTWVAFLDDDDYWYPHHLHTLMSLAVGESADFAYSWFDGNNPFPMHRGRQMNPAEPHHTTMTVLVRTELAQAVGFGDGTDLHQDWSGEDWKFILGCLERGARFVGTGEVTWHYSVHAGNTSGLVTKW